MQRIKLRNSIWLAKLLWIICTCIALFIWGTRPIYVHKMTDHEEPSIRYQPSVNSLIKEEVLQYKDHSRMILQTSFTLSTHLIKYVNVMVTNNNLNTMHSMHWTYEASTPKEISEVQEYFVVLKTPTGSCHKLASFGGDMSCLKVNGFTSRLDGNKLLCMEKELQIKNTLDVKDKCLVLSFGMQEDTSFDETIEDAGCEVHMFDIFNYKKEYLKSEKFMHFHQIGLAKSREKIHYYYFNVTVDFYNLRDIIWKYGLQGRLINVLKIDIEGDEWKVLDSLCSEPYLDVIGQIAVEVHAFELVKMNSTEHLRNARYWINIFRRLEERGFRRIAYWDVQHPKLKYKDLSGTVHEIAGEMLLVNDNWFREDFRNNLRQNGYNFHSDFD